MNRTDAPKKQPVPFAVNGQRENLLSTTPAGDNTASYNDGFPPVTMILKAAGGLPPKGQDMNQILFELSSICRWFTAGALNEFDATFASSIGGYPKASVLVGDDGATIYISTIDANSNNPNSVTTGWLNLSKITAIAALSGGANKLPYFSGANTAAQTDLTSVGRDIIGKSTIADILTYLGLGEAAKLGVASEGQMKDGTSLTLVPSVKAVMSLFPNRSFSIPGYIRIPDVPGGLVIQWGNYVTTNSSQDVNLPFNYSVAQLACVATYNGPSTIYGYVTAQAKNTAQVTLHGRNASGTPVGGTFYVISIGF